MTILLISSDLMIQSRVASAASQAGIAAPSVISPHALTEAQDETDDVPSNRLAILDLSAPGLEVSLAVATLRERFPGVRIVAFAPHVHTANLASARAAGCDRVLSRGQFDREIESIVAKAVRGE